MRITNKVMQNNSVRNINRNKELQDNLSTQIATGKKISRPSEDPVIAIRALRLRSDVTQVNQYFEKNAPDADQWLKLTESSIKTTVSVVKDMIEQCQKGASDQLQTSDRKTIIDSLKALGGEIYATGDADYAGRYIFTGYRTDVSLSFTENTNQSYEITELFRKGDLQQMPYVDMANLSELSETNFENGGAAALTEQQVTYGNYFRYRLSYDQIDPKMTPGAVAVNGTDYNITLVDETATNKEAIYADMENQPDGVFLIPSTGELILGENVYDAIMASGETDNFAITYTKTSWSKGDLRPQHYFACSTKDPDTGADISYNPDYLNKKTIDQAIQYQVGFNQHIQINTYAEQIFQHAIGRDVDEILELANQLEIAENIEYKFKKMATDTATYSEDEITAIQGDLEAAKKSVTLLKNQLQKRFSNYITRMQGYLDDTNDALTEVGNRSSRLQLISNRLSEQNTTFETLQSENEDVDLTQTAVSLSSAKVNYEAALMATGDLIQTTLLNYL